MKAYIYKDDIFKHLKIIEKLYKVVDSCETLEQYENAMKMIIRYHIKRSDSILVTRALVSLEDYALAKGKMILFNKIYKKLI